MRARLGVVSLFALAWLALEAPSGKGEPDAAPRDAGPVTAHLENPRLREIRFHDLAPEGAALYACWSGIGIDSRNRVYFAPMDRGGANPDDTILFRYDPRTRQRERLGTLRGISEAEGNAEPGETFAKVHVSLLEHEGKLYFASHDVDDLRGDYGRRFGHRGGHFYALDLASDRFEDLSVHEPGGVSIRHQGIIAMDILRATDQLVGFTYPLGDLLLFDLAARRTTRIPGPPEYRFDNVARQVIAAANGRVYFAYDRPDFRLWRLDPASGSLSPTAEENRLHTGYLHGMVETRDRQSIYLVDHAGTLYRFDVPRERVVELGPLLPPEEIAAGRSIHRIASLALSLDETRLYTVPYRFPDGAGPILYEYDLARDRRRRLLVFPEHLHGDVTGSAVTDERGCVYFAWHARDSAGRPGQDARLIQLCDDR